MENKDKQAITSVSAEDILKRAKTCFGERSLFESHWQSLHDYFYVEAQDINSSSMPGSELNTSSLYDATTLESADVLASGFMSYLTPPTSKWFRLRSKNPRLSENKNVSDYLEAVTDEVFHALNTSNFYNQVISAYKSSGVYGTSLLMEEEDMTDNVRFYNMPIKQVGIVEDARGRVAEYYIEFEYTAYQAATRWGVEALSREMKEELTARQDSKKHKFLLYIGNRHVRQVEKQDKKNMPIQAVWVDVEGKRVVDEGGYNEFPAMAHRFDKRPFVAWGYSPAMKTLPFARTLNLIAKTSLRVMMKHSDPPIALPHNAFLMPFNGNPRAINYYKKTAMDGAKDIFAFGNYGNPDVSVQSIEYYSQKVRTLMYNDVFLAFNNITKQMNNPEVMERISEKMSMLGPAVGRFTAEVLNPIIIRTIGILYRRGKLPPMPDELIQDPQYEIDYVSALAQAQKRSELNALTTAIGMLGQMAPFAPEVMDKFSPDRAVDETWNILGAPIRVLRDDEEIKEIRDARAQAQAQQQEAMMMGQTAMTAKDASEAERNMKQTQTMGVSK